MEGIFAGRRGGGEGGEGWVCTVFEELEIFSENKAFRTSGSRICTISAA